MTVEDGPNYSDGKTPNAVEMAQMWSVANTEALKFEAEIWDVEINRRKYGLNAPTQEEVDWVW